MVMFVLLNLILILIREKMKKLTILALILAIHTVHCQTQPPKLDELNIPSSPAFVLLDESPANIEKPTNPKDFTISLLSASQEGGAIETAPYWLVDHNNYTFANDVKNHYPILQTFALSIASVKKSDTTTVSVGFRVQLFRQYFDEAAILASKAIIEGILSNPPINTVALKTEADKLDAQRGREKFSLELAGAYSGEGTNYKNLTGKKIGAWINFRYTPAKDSFLDIVALARFSKTFGGLTNQTNDSSFFDFGGSLSRQGDTFDIQLEYVYRRDTTLNINYDRLAFIANYQVMPGIVAVASFGQNFDKEKDLFTAFGVKFGILNRDNKS